MLMLSRSLVPSKTQLAGKLLPEKVGDPWLSNFTSHLGFSTTRPDFVNNGNYSGKTYVDFSIYKGKAAVSVSHVPPKFSKIDSGFSKVEKRGVVMLRFMPAIGPRKYDKWKEAVTVEGLLLDCTSLWYMINKLFALSATEVGSLISLGPTESCEFSTILQ